MLKLSPSALRVTAVTAAAAFVLLPMAPASAATANASAYGADVHILNGIHLGPLAVSSFPPNTDSTVVPLNIPTIADIAGIFSTSHGDLSTSTSTATAGTAALGILGTAITGYGISADAVSSTCTAVGTNVSGSTTIANLKLTGQNAINLTAVQQQTVLTIPNVASVLIGEQITNPDGSLTVNALHITLLGGNAADIVLGSSTCGPNVPQAVGDAFSFQALPVVVGALALMVLLGFGIRTGVRRIRSAA